MKFAPLFVYFVFAIFWQQGAESLSCLNDGICKSTIVGSHCEENICVCSDDTILSGDSTRCMPFADGYGGVCEESQQCSARLGVGGACVDGVCKCSENHHYLIGKCWRDVPLDGECFVEEECYAAYDYIGVSCIDNTCQCLPDYYRRIDSCRPIARQNDPCILNEDCQCDGTVGECATRVCQCSSSHSTLANNGKIHDISVKNKSIKSEPPCDPGTFLNPTTGQCALELGSPCSIDDDQCAQGVFYAKCQKSQECGCENILRSISVDNRACSKAATVFNSTACTDSVQCAAYGSNSICDPASKKCLCKEGTHVDDKLFCRISRQAGESCDSNNDCYSISNGGFVQCLSNICSCIPGSHESTDKHDCHKDSHNVGDICLEDNDCMFDYGSCDQTSKICKCSDSYFESEEKLCVGGIGSICSENSDCSGVNSAICSTNTTQCQCEEGFVTSYDYKTCLPVVNQGENCIQTEQCDSSMGELKKCRDGTCECEDNAQYIVGRCYAMKALGEPCGARAECVPPNGDIDAYMCQNGKCACQYGHNQDGIKCL